MTSQLRFSRFRNTADRRTNLAEETLMALEISRLLVASPPRLAGSIHPTVWVDAIEPNPSANW